MEKAFNSLPNNKILALTRLKAFAEDKFSIAKMMIPVFDRSRKHCGKRSNFTSSTMFSLGFLFSVWRKGLSNNLYSYYVAGHIFEREKTELVEKYEEQIDVLRQELKALQERMEVERDSLGQRYEAEKDRIEEVLAQQIRDEIEVCNGKLKSIT